MNDVAIELTSVPQLRELLKVEEQTYSSINGLTTNLYDNRAKAYEWLVSKSLYNKIMWGTSPQNYVEFALSAMKTPVNNTLDIGCGGLIQTAQIYSNVYTSVVLLDNSLDMLRLAKQRLNYLQALRNNFTFLHADAFGLPFDDESFEKVVSFGMLHMFTNKQDYLQEALRVLKPGGAFYFSVLTTRRKWSGKYLNFLYKKGEVGLPLSENEILELFKKLPVTISYYTVGSMVFISGTKNK